MSELLSSIATGGGGGLILLQTMNDDARVRLKRAVLAIDEVQTANAFNVLQEDTTPYFYDTATLQQAANTSEQTIVDIGPSVEGVFTSLFTNKISSSQTLTIRVTIDGVETVYAFPGFSGLPLGILGGFLQLSGSETGESVSDGADGDAGFDSLPNTFILTPLQSIERGFGVVFRDSLKITVQGDTALQAGATTNYNMAAWATKIPTGL